MLQNEKSLFTIIMHIYIIHYLFAVMLIIAVIVVTATSFLQKGKEYLGLKELRCNKE